jgi:hypothetical protein
VNIIAAQGRVVANFALKHFRAAKRFSTVAAEIESAHVGQPFGDFFEEIHIYCSSCIIVAAASLEALINELYIAPGPLRSSVEDFDRDFWGPKGLERKSALAKYNRALSFLNKPVLSERDTTYQHADTLIGFRNYLIHFKPLWDDHRRSRKELEESLQGVFNESPFVGADSDFLVMRCMSSGCASWAVNTALSFVRDFGQKSGLDPNKLSQFK